jgi:hypothetical protein
LIFSSTDTVCLGRLSSKIVTGTIMDMDLDICELVDSPLSFALRELGKLTI